MPFPLKRTGAKFNIHAFITIKRTGAKFNIQAFFIKKDIQMQNLIFKPFPLKRTDAKINIQALSISS